MTLILATRNRHKAAEIHAILGVNCLTLADFPGAPPLVEDADTFAGNALRKAAQLAQWLASTRPAMPAGSVSVQLPPGSCSVPARPVGKDLTGPEANPGNAATARTFVMADDSGLEVDALGGAPGVYSARFAGMDCGVSGNSTDAENNAKLLRLLQEVTIERRTARFRCVLALMEANPPASAPLSRLFEGACEGHIGFAARGKGGFGYDPLFIPEGFAESFAELGESVKNQLSHRAKALQKLHQWLRADQGCEPAEATAL